MVNCIFPLLVPDGLDRLIGPSEGELATVAEQAAAQLPQVTLYL